MRARPWPRATTPDISQATAHHLLERREVKHDELGKGESVFLVTVMIPIITVVGYSNTGKTRCLLRLISILTRRGYRVASAKHCHDGFELDVEGKDSWKHKQAGAAITLLSSKNQIGIMGETESPLPLEQLCARYCHEVDLLLAEGYSWEPVPKILIVHGEKLEWQRISAGEDVIALVGDEPIDSSLPHFSFDELERLASLLEQRFLLPPRSHQT